MSTRPILAVARNPHNLALLAEFLNGAGYQTFAANGLDACERFLMEPNGIGLALVDVSGFGGGVWDHCDQLTAKGIPLVVIASARTASLALSKGIAHGARGVLTKPLRVKELLETVRNVLQPAYSP